jgi:hypothetical protein
VLNNTSEGYQSNITGKISKRWDFGLSANLAYSWMTSKDYTSIPAEIAADAFQRSPVVGNPNFPQFSWSRYGLNHRIVGSAMFNKQYGFMASTIGLFIEVGKGNRYSFVYAGDINGDGITTNDNDLIYVPRDNTDINFGTVDGAGTGVVATDAAAQWAALDAFIEQDNYLKNRRGQYAERNGATLPWFSQIDLRYMHDFNFEVAGKVNTVQLSFDILNVGNMISSNWGVRKLANTLTPLKVNGVDYNGTPWLQFNPDLKESYVDDFSVRSKWQIQFGLRYIFN